MLEPGSQIGRFEIQRQLGLGGMSTVYVAHDPKLGRLVAIKFIAGHIDGPDARTRFESEARSAALLDNPHIVAVYELDVYESQPFIVMAYVQGETLAQKIRSRQMVPLVQKLRWIEELCIGLAYAHRMSVIHRDIKPANLMVDRTGRLRILDFGIARIMGESSRTTALVGTPGYMAPEQIKGQPIDQRADLFSIGVVFYELLTYVEAFPGDTMATVTYRVLSEPPAPLDDLVPGVTPDLKAVVERALEKDVTRRWQDAASLGEAIARVRREYERNPRLGIGPVTEMLPRDFTPPPTGSRGTGSARRPIANDATVAALTPPPGRKPTDRGVVTSLRQKQVVAAVEEAQALLENYELDGAAEAVGRALALDPNNQAAQELKIAIDSAFAASEGPTLLGHSSSDPGMTTAIRHPSERPPGVPAPTPPPVMPRVDTAPGTMVVTPSERAASAAAWAQTGAPAVTTEPASAPVTAEARPAATPTQTSAAPPKQTPKQKSDAMAQFVARASAGFGAAAASMQAGAAAVVARARQLGPATRARTASVKPAVGPTSPQGTPAAARKLATVPWVWIGAGAGVLVVVAGVALYLPGRTPPVGTVVIDAVPWGTVTSITATADGTPQTFEAGASTPFPLNLPAGEYRVTLRGPLPDAPAQTVTVTIEANGLGQAPVVRFSEATPEEYFEQYLATSTPLPAADTPLDGAAPAEGSAAPVAPPLPVPSPSPGAVAR